jgi:hypothetical protein
MALERDLEQQAPAVDPVRRVREARLRKIKNICVASVGSVIAGFWAGRDSMIRNRITHESPGPVVLSHATSSLIFTVLIWDGNPNNVANYIPLVMAWAGYYLGTVSGLALEDRYIYGRS